MPLATVFKSILSKLCLTQKEFSEKTELPLNSIAKICIGRRPRKDTLEIILDHLPVHHQGELLAVWLDDAIPDQHRDKLQIRQTDNSTWEHFINADNPSALAQRDAIFKNLCWATKVASTKLQQAAQDCPKFAQRVRDLASEVS